MHESKNTLWEVRLPRIPLGGLFFTAAWQAFHFHQKLHHRIIKECSSTEKRPF